MKHTELKALIDQVNQANNSLAASFELLSSITEITEVSELTGAQMDRWLNAAGYPHIMKDISKAQDSIQAHYDKLTEESPDKLTEESPAFKKFKQAFSNCDVMVVGGCHIRWYHQDELTDTGLQFKIANIDCPPYPVSLTIDELRQVTWNPSEGEYLIAETRLKLCTLNTHEDMYPSQPQV